MTNFKLTRKGHYVTENNIFINHWNLKTGTAHVPYSETEGPVIEAESDDPNVIESAAYNWKNKQRLAEEERKNNDPVYLREQIALLIAKLSPAEKKISLIGSLKTNSDDITAILAGYDSHKSRVKIEAKEAKVKAAALAKKLAAEKKLKIKEAKKKVGNKEAIVYRAEWLEYVNGNGQAYRGSRVCKATRISKITADVVITETGKVYVDGLGKLKINLTNYETGEVVRSDYDMSNL